jgi:hypothetical protein
MSERCKKKQMMTYIDIHTACSAFVVPQVRREPSWVSDQVIEFLFSLQFLSVGRRTGRVAFA